MSAATATTDVGHVHHLLLYDTLDELLATAVPFVREGLTAGQPAILVCPDDHRVLLTDALDRDPRLIVIHPGELYTRAVRALERYRRVIAGLLAGGARRVRVVGEPNFGPGPDRWAECGRFEALANLVLADCPLTSVCAYPTTTLPASVIANMITAHPFLLTPTAGVGNARYVDPAALLRRWDAAGPQPVGQPGPALELATVTTLGQVAALRRRLRATLTPLVADQYARADLVTAVHEVVVNGLVHGHPPVRVRLCTPPGKLTCEITDTGPGFDDPLAGYLRPARDNAYGPGAGLWLARQACDRVDTARTPSGFTVRLSTAVER